MDVMDEVSDIVAQANAREEDENDDNEEETQGATTTRRQVRKANGSKKKESAELQDSDKTLEEQDAEKLLGKKLPKPAENVKSLGSMYAKYDIGQSAEFKVQVWRTYPKIAPGGIKFDGFYDTWELPIDEETLQAEYGGGTYRIKIIGPHPTKQNLPKHYDSIELHLAGPPKFDRVPRAMQTGTETTKDDADMPRMQAPSSYEHPKLAEQVMKIMQTTVQAEREERRRSEDKLEAQRADAGNAIAPVIESERRRADEIISVERERREEHERRAERRLEEERERHAEDRRRMELQQSGQRSLGEEIKSLAQAGLFNRDDSSAKEMFTQILEKHRSEMEGMTTRHTQFVDSIRSGHMSEVQAIRDAHRREMEAEREASRSRETRIDERLQSEREERRRDQDRFKEQSEERDRNWRDRMEQAREVLESAWTSRHQNSTSMYEQRILWFQAEVDRLKSDYDILRVKEGEKGDVATQLMKIRDLQEIVKEFSPAPAAPASSSGGIGISAGEDWKQTFAEGLAERAPQIMQAVFGGGAAQQPPLQEGQILTVDPSTGQPFPHGPMVVVRDPNSGQLAMSPKSALDEHQRARDRQGGLLQPPEQQRRRRPQVMPPPEEVRRRSKKTAVQPNFAEGMPKLTPPWESTPGDLPPPPAVRPEPRMSTRSRRDPDPSPEPMEMSSQERQGIKTIAKLVHESVMEADEPEEFVAKVMNQYDANTIRAIVGGYTTEQLARGIHQVEPNSAGATPGGQAFILEAFSQLRRALSD